MFFITYAVFLIFRSQITDHSRGGGGEGRRRRGISRGQQSIKEALENIDCQFTANEEGRGGEGRGGGMNPKNILWGIR